MSYLLDTNIFLEILLDQDKKEVCKNFLQTYAGELFISDFSLHSIGVILYQNNKSDIFNQFLEDTLDKIEILTLSKEKYREINDVYHQYKLDFDDSYQFLLAQENQMTIVTQDVDFKIVDKIISIRFI